MSFNVKAACVKALTQVNSQQMWMNCNTFPISSRRELCDLDKCVIRCCYVNNLNPSNLGQCKYDAYLLLFKQGLNHVV